MDKHIPMPFPANGVDVTDEEHQQRPNTSRLAVNVRLRDTIHRRLRGGSRPGLTRPINAKVGGATSLIQMLEPIVTANAQALPATRWDADLERFYADDPSVPVETGWTYVGDYAYPITTYTTNDPRTRRPTKTKGSGNPPPPGNEQMPGIKQRPKIIWPDPAAIDFPTPLSGTQLNPKARHPVTFEIIPGTFAFFPPKGTVLAVGNNHPLRTIFTPDNVAKWFAVKAEQTIDVNTYTAGYTTYNSVNWPTTVTFYFEWGSESWTTTGTLTLTGGTDPDITWSIAGLPHTLVDLNNGEMSGRIDLLASAGAMLRYFITGPTLYFDLDVKINNVTYPSTGGSTPAASAGPNPLSWGPFTWFGSATVYRVDGTAVTNDLKVKVTGPTV